MVQNFKRGEKKMLTLGDIQIIPRQNGGLLVPTTFLITILSSHNLPFFLVSSG